MARHTHAMSTMTLCGPLAQDKTRRETKHIDPFPHRAGDLDGKAHTYDEHEDSVYGLAWSVADPWLVASLSYDGRVVVNK